MFLSVCVRVTPIAKSSGLRLAAAACVGEGRARGQAQAVSPCGCAGWLWRSGACFALLSSLLPVEASEVSPAEDRALSLGPWGGAGPTLPRAAAPGPGIAAGGTAEGRKPPPHFLGFSPISSPTVGYDPCRVGHPHDL